MKFLTILLLSSFSISAFADLVVDETNTIKSNENSTIVVKNSKSAIENNEDVILNKIEELNKAPIIKTESESVVTSSSIYNLVLKPSKNAQTYSLKVSKDKKIFLNARFYAGPASQTHNIELTGGIGTYKIEYVEYDSVNISLEGIFKKTINLIYKIPEIIRNVKTSKWVQARDPRITNLSASIVAGLNGEYEKVLAIDDWITQNIVYNYTSTMMSQKIDAITTLEMKMGICTGYANLFAALARASGLEAKAITGRAKIDGKSYFHQWNEVKIDGTWYFIDPTWNAGRKRRDFFTKVEDYPEQYRGRKEVKPY